MKKLSKKQTLSYLALQKVARLQELLKMTQNAEVVVSSAMRLTHKIVSL